MSDNLQFVKLKDLDINDCFFESLKADYPEFEQWILSKGDRDALVQINDDGSLNGLLTYKMEYGSIEGALTPILAERIFKIATFKINPHGTRLGERFIKKALDLAVVENADICYLTAFSKQKYLGELFKSYGFYESSENSRGEHILVKNLRGPLTNDIYLDYPRINASEQTNKYLLSIYPDYHSQLFPDSILNNESINILDDESYTNSINKIYICKMSSAKAIRPGDVIIIYRTGDGVRPARFSAVATSVCVVEECKGKRDFIDANDFYEYCRKYSVFSRNTLENFYQSSNTIVVLKMTYNAAFSQRITRGRLIEDFGLDQEAYWGCLPLTNSQFINIVQAGGVFENLIVY